MQDHAERIEFFLESVEGDLLSAQTHARRVQIKRHARQCQGPAPDPIAKSPPVECEICRHDESSNAESEQVRKIQRRERRESCKPARDAVLRKPVQPESKCGESNCEAQIEIQESL